jgi:hypothetical protein
MAKGTHERITSLRQLQIRKYKSQVRVNFSGPKQTEFRYPVLPYVGAFAFVRDADKPSNVNTQDNHSHFFSIHSISAVSQK